MIADDRYCDDVLIQIAAISKSLKTLENSILESHLKSCVAYEIQIGNLDILNLSIDGKTHHFLDYYNKK